VTQPAVRPRSRLPALLAFGLVVVVVLAAVGLIPVREVFDQQEDVAAAQARLEAIQAENDRLEREIEALQTPAEVERLAREQFGYVRPGEIGYVVVTPPDTVPEAVETEPLLERDDTPWWRDLWDWLTGRDLLEDG